MISVEEARERILALIPRLEPETTPLADALGQVLAADAYSPLTIPPGTTRSASSQARGAICPAASRLPFFSATPARLARPEAMPTLSGMCWLQ